jgi:hypothetical protein
MARIVGVECLQWLGRLCLHRYLPLRCRTSAGLPRIVLEAKCADATWHGQQISE